MCADWSHDCMKDHLCQFKGPSFKAAASHRTDDVRVCRESDRKKIKAALIERKGVTEKDHSVQSSDLPSFDSENV